MKIAGKKILVVAGSNVLFGVDSKMLEDALGESVVNFGVNAGVGLPVILNEAKKVLKEGDVVLLPLEYPLYSYDGKAGEQMIDYVFSRDSELFWRLSLFEKAYMVWHVSFKRVFEGYFVKSHKGVRVGVYGAFNVDDKGDQLHTSLSYRDESMLRELDRYERKPETYGRDFDADALGWRYLESFVKWCRSRDIRVIFMPSVLMRSPYYFSDNKEKWFYENLPNIVRDRGWEFAGKPYEYMYHKEDFFNTNFHLIDEAKERRTLQMIRDLSRIM